MGKRTEMQLEPPIAFVNHSPETPGLELRINFGLFAGREATPAEIDDLGQIVLEAASKVTIVAEHRHEISHESEASLHQVRVDLAPEVLPDDFSRIDDLERALVSAAERWARDCIAERHVELTEP